MQAGAKPVAARSCKCKMDSLYGVRSTHVRGARVRVHSTAAAARCRSLQATPTAPTPPSVGSCSFFSVLESGTVACAWGGVTLDWFV